MVKLWINWKLMRVLSFEAIQQESPCDEVLLCWGPFQSLTKFGVNVPNGIVSEFRLQCRTLEGVSNYEVCVLPYEPFEETNLSLCLILISRFTAGRRRYLVQFNSMIQVSLAWLMMTAADAVSLFTHYRDKFTWKW